MKRIVFLVLSIMAISTIACSPMPEKKGAPNLSSPSSYVAEEEFVDAHGILIYYEALGKGQPLVVLHGGPGASHDYFLPYLLPLIRRNRVIFIDERGSGRSQQLENPSAYTVENMAEDVEAVRQGLDLGKINLLGHSYGGVLAQAYSLKYPDNLTHLILRSTFSSTKKMNKVLEKLKKTMAPELRTRIEKIEKAGLFGYGKEYQKNRYTSEYMVAAWGEGYFPYLYQNHPDLNFDPERNGMMAWELYREMWGSNGEFVIDGNLTSVEYTDRLSSIKLPTLITVGDHDQCDSALSQEMHEKIAGSTLVILPKSGHMTFVDQPSLFVSAVDEFLHPVQ